MYTITFYSFKGGVGRTMALVNTAAELARRGRKVLLVDFDLEAPGLDTFDRLRPAPPHLGLVECVTEYMHTKSSPDVRDYIYSAGPVGKKGGELWVMPAGRRDANYGRALVNLNWKTLYRDCQGYLFFEDIRKQWEEDVKPDYVLIDSRTGHTDVEGICTRQLPDAVVMLFFPNEQNLVGLRDVCQQVRAERTRGLMKDIRLHFVMSNVPDLDDEDRVLRRRLKEFRKQLEFKRPDAVIHRYESVLLFNQAVFVLDRPRSRLAREYQRLMWALIQHNPADKEGALRFLHDHAQLYLPAVARDVTSQARLQLWGEDKVSTSAIIGGLSGAASRDKELPISGRLRTIVTNFLDDVDVLLRVAQCGVLAGRLVEAINLLTRVLQIKPDMSQALLERALCNNRLGDKQGAAEDLLSYLKSVNIPPSDVERPKGSKYFLSPLFQSPSISQSDVERAYYELHAIAPDRIIEAVGLPVFQELDASFRLLEVPSMLPDTNAGIQCAIGIARGLITDGLLLLDASEWLVSLLIGKRRWNEVIEWVRVQSSENLSVRTLFDFAIASWASTGKPDEHLFRLVLENAQEGDFDGDVIEGRQIECWALWAVGNAPEALHRLEGVIEYARKGEESRFSYWCCEYVPLARYLEDSQQLRRMIQGEPIRPAFLGS